jgi:hypothetical protein
LKFKSEEVINAEYKAGKNKQCRIWVLHYFRETTTT